MTAILSFDLATKTGVAFGRPGEKPRFHTEVLGPTGGDQAIRFAQTIHMTRRLIQEYDPDLISIEAPLASGGGGSRARPELAMGIRGCVLGMAHLLKVPSMQLAVQTVRKQFLGHGSIKRADAKVAAMRKCHRLGWDTANDNEADACALWYTTCIHVAPESTPHLDGLFTTG